MKLYTHFKIIKDLNFGPLGSSNRHIILACDWTRQPSMFILDSPLCSTIDVIQLLYFSSAFITIELDDRKNVDAFSILYCGQRFSLSAL